MHRVNASIYFQKLVIVETLMHEAQKMPLKFYRDSNKGKSNNIYELDLILRTILNLLNWNFPDVFGIFVKFRFSNQKLTKGTFVTNSIFCHPLS